MKDATLEEAKASEKVELFDYISIVEVDSAPGQGSTPRVSTLVAHSQSLGVMGNLPHGYRFEPMSVADAKLLIGWLLKWSRRQGGSK